MDTNWLDTLNQSLLTPPDYVFSIWTLLYILIGYNLVYSKNQNANLFLLASLILGYIWIPTFNSRNLFNSLVILFLSWITGVLYYYYQPNKTLKLTILPYVIWMTLALYLSWYLYQNN